MARFSKLTNEKMNSFLEALGFMFLAAAFSFTLFSPVSAQEETGEADIPLFCGDGEVNQEWEMCDGGEGCSDQCQLEDASQCTDLTLARVSVQKVQNFYAGDASFEVYVGGMEQSNRVLPTTWFPVFMNGEYVVDEVSLDEYEDVQGLAVHRDVGEITVRLFETDENDPRSSEHVRGHVEFWPAAVEAETLDFRTEGNEPENFSDGVHDEEDPDQDELSIEDGQALFWLTAKDERDEFTATYSEPLMCEEDTESGDSESLAGSNEEVVSEPVVTKNPSSSRKELSAKEQESRGEVLGASLFAGCSEGPYLNDYLHVDRENNPEEVAKLQMFLNGFLDINLEVDGQFDEETLAAVKAFQLTYSGDVLAPWVNAGYTDGIGLNEPTGYVYITTKNKINELMCPSVVHAFPPLVPDATIVSASLGTA